MINKELKERLNKWCDEMDTEFSRFSFEEVGNKVKIYRCDGSGFSQKLHSLNESELKSFLDEADELKKELAESNRTLEEEMLL